jgi:membrane-associated protein
MFNVVGGFTWVTVIMFAGYYFGNMPLIRNNFPVVIYFIVITSMLPGIIGYLKHRKSRATPPVTHP